MQGGFLMRNMWILVIFLSMAGCGFSKDDWNDEDRSRIKYCVELTGVDILKQCFGGDKTAYTNWKRCVENGRDPVKCYVKKVSPPPPPDVGELDCGGNPYFCFRYFTANLTEEEANTWRGLLGASNPAPRRMAFCVFQAQPSWRGLEVKGGQLRDL